jgi:hypothetical protein
METIIQAGHKRLRIGSVPVTTNPKTRESRLFKNMFHHMAKSGSAIVRSYIMFKPYTIFLGLAAVFGIAALIPSVRFLFHWMTGHRSGNIQSLIFAAIMAVAALLSLALGVISDLLRINRVLIEDELQRVKELQYCRDAAGMEPALDVDFTVPTHVPSPQVQPYVWAGEQNVT